MKKGDKFFTSGLDCCSFKLYIFTSMACILSMGILSGQILISQKADAQSLETPSLFCSKAKDQPIDPVEMDFINFRSVGNSQVEVIHSEKEIFECSRITDPVGSVFMYKDVTLFTPIHGSVQGGVFVGLSVGDEIHASVCDRNFSGKIHSCNSFSVPRTAPPPLTRCTEEKPILPLEMKTLELDESKTKIARISITAEKHSYSCTQGNSPLPTKIKETILFTIIPQKGPGTGANIGKLTYLSEECFKTILSPDINISCSELSFPPQDLTGTNITTTKNITNIK